MVTNLTINDGLNVLLASIPNPNNIRVFELDQDNKTIRFAWFGCKFRFDVKYLSVEQMDPPGILASNATTCLMEQLIKNHVIQARLIHS